MQLYMTTFTISMHHLNKLLEEFMGKKDNRSITGWNQLKLNPPLGTFWFPSKLKGWAVAPAAF